jgi:TRAP-type uncharacterized transport system fused permease subunit
MNAMVTFIYMFSFHQLILVRIDVGDLSLKVLQRMFHWFVGRVVVVVVVVAAAAANVSGAAASTASTTAASATASASAAAAVTAAHISFTCY